MSVKCRKQSVSKAADKAIDRPFDPTILRRAQEMAPHYRIVMEAEPEGEPGWGAMVLEMPNVFGWGETAEQCIQETREILVTMLAFMLERGDGIPVAGGELKREEQVNVRLTTPEKIQIEDASQREGFRGISDFVRSASLRAARESVPVVKRTPRLRKRQTSKVK